jgi:hypothetical protein
LHVVGGKIVVLGRDSVKTTLKLWKSSWQSQKPRHDVAIGESDILATYSRTKALLGGMSEADAEVRGMVAAIMGAQMRTVTARLPHGHDHHVQAEKDRDEQMKKSTIPAESFDRQVAVEMGDFFGHVFLPMIKELVQAGLSYD